MASDSKKFEDAAANGKPFVCSSSFKGDGTVSYVILWDDRYWRVDRRQHDLIMDQGFTPEELELPGFTENDWDDEYPEPKEQGYVWNL